MTPSDLWAFLVSGYIFTVAIEAPILFFGLSPRHSWQTRLIAGFWLTACTYPIVVLVLYLSIIPLWGYAVYLAIAETFAPGAECLLFYFAFAREADLRASEGGDAAKPLDAPADEKPVPIALSPYDTWRDMAVIIVANLASFLLGMWIQLVWQ